MGGRARVFAFALLLIAACAACSTTTTSSTPPSNRPIEPVGSGPAEPADCRSRIEQATFDDLATIDRVSECRFTPGGLQASAEVLAAGGDREALWSALWIQQSGGTDPVLVRRYLDEDDDSIRAMAAGLAARYGERRGLEVLLDLADTDDMLLGSAPPASIGEFAIRSLARMVHADDAPSGDVDPDTLGELATAWRAWLGERLAGLGYAPGAGWSR